MTRIPKTIRVTPEMHAAIREAQRHVAGANRVSVNWLICDMIADHTGTEHTYSMEPPRKRKTRKPR